MENKYRENYDGLTQLPMVTELKRKNKRLRKENRRLNRLVLKLYDRLARGFDHAYLKSHIENVEEEDFIEVVKTQVEVEKKPNIVYELVEDCDESNIRKVYIKQERNMVEQHAMDTESNDVVDSDEEEEEVVEEEVVEEEEEVVVEEEEEEEEEEVVEEEVVEEEVVEEEVEEEEEVVEEEVEEVVEIEEEEEEEEVEEVEEEEEEEVEEEEVVEEEVVEEEEEVVDEEVEEEEVAEEEVVEEEQEEETDDEVFEITIEGKEYYVTNQINSIIYALDENGDISLEVGKYVNGKAVFVK